MPWPRTPTTATRSFWDVSLLAGTLASASGEGIGLDLSSRPYVAAVQRGAATAWSEGIPGIQSGETTVAFARLVQGPDARPRAFLVAAFYPERLLDRLPDGLPADSSLVLTDRRGFILYSSDPVPSGVSDISSLPQVKAGSDIDASAAAAASRAPSPSTAIDRAKAGASSATRAARRRTRSPSEGTDACSACSAVGGEPLERSVRRSSSR